MKKIFLFLLLACSAWSAIGQTYADHMQEANRLYQSGEYRASAEAFEKGFALGNAEASDLYNAACSRALAGDAEKALDHLAKAVEKGWINADWAQRDSDLVSLHQQDRWQLIVADMKARQAAEEARYDQELIAQLKEIGEMDQVYRQQMDEAEKTYGWDSPEMKELWEKQRLNDSICLARIELVIAEHGYPGKSLVGRQSSVAFLVIQHADLKVQEKYLPLLQEAAEKGELRKSSLAPLIDRVRVGNGQEQLYGSQLHRNPDTGQLEFFPIEDEVRVDERRSEMGLEPLEDYARRFGLEYRAPTEKD